jgi:hypothetical protein
MWADTLLAAERAHLLRLLAWSAMSIIAGTAIMAWLRIGSRSSPLLRHFAIQATVWGAALGAVGLALSARLDARDLASATRLDRMLWLCIGLEVGAVFVGATLAVVGWRIGRRLGLVGAGVGVMVQGFALAVLDLMLVARISR